MNSIKALRVEQIDAHSLDKEIREIVGSTLEECVSSMPTVMQRLIDRAKPEIRLLIDAVIWTSRLYTGTSPGQRLLDVFYKNYSPVKISAHFGINVLAPYLMRRITDFRPTTYRFFEKLEALLTLLNVIHYLHFLRFGGFSTLTERFLSLRHFNREAPTIGTVNLDNQNRELLWHSFRDLILLLWPIYRIVESYWKKWSRKANTASFDGKCVMCEKDFVAPVEMVECGHVCCYWCFATRLTSRENCPICDKQTGIRAAHGVRLFDPKQHKYD
ncbi:unnamed protein product, partial [Mesorhabditis belari]|uniref:RING-type E3 ubiquitin transferase (cysteine targeting) n=1 Tax=Mesorhabditis belari TaxID=2138241 RepID=A0AAF3J6J7_9BILA